MRHAGQTVGIVPHSIIEEETTTYTSDLGNLGARTKSVERRKKRYHKVTGSLGGLEGGGDGKAYCKQYLGGQSPHGLVVRKK